MNLKINDAEIKSAITEYIKNQGIACSDKTVTIKLIAGRKDNGHTAEITIEAKEAAIAHTGLVPKASGKSAEVTSINVATAEPEEDSNEDEIVLDDGLSGRTSLFNK